MIRHNYIISFVLIILLALHVISRVSAQETTDPPHKGSIVVSSKDYTEQLILGQIVALLLEEAGYNVVDKTGIGGSNVIREAMQNDEIDVYVELTGTGLAVHNGLPAVAFPTDPDKAHELARSLDASQGIVWLDRGGFNNTYAIMARDDLLSQGIKSLEDLAEYMNENDAPFSICVENDFYGREFDGLHAMEERYGFAFKPENIQLMDLDGVYDALRNSECDIAEGYATDGRGSAWGFTNLDDPLAFFPFYNPAPVIRQEVLDVHPELRELLNSFVAYLDDQTISQLNARVDIGADGLFNSGDEEIPREVAQSFLRSIGLMKLPAIVVSSKNYTEQLILGQILVALLEDAGYEVVDKTGIGGSNVIREAMQNGEIDLYVELTGTALAVYNGLPSIAFPTQAERSYHLARSLDAPRGIVWLEPGAFNDTYAIMVREDLRGQGIESLEDLAEYMNENDSPLSICVENDFYGREFDGLRAMEQSYGFSFLRENIQLMDLDGVYDGLRNGECDVAEGYATDGRGIAWGFTNLEDPLAFFPFYNPAPVIREEVLRANLGLEELITSFGSYLTDQTMSQLNARVDIGTDGIFNSGDEESPAEVAHSFLREHRLLKPAKIVVSSKDYTEQLILGQILLALLDDAGYEAIDKTGIGGSNVIREAMQNGEIDVYVELTGTGLAVHNGLPSSALPADPDRAYYLAQTLDALNGIIWLDRGVFNDTYAIMVRDDLLEEGINSLADLADHMNENDSPLSICVENDFYGREFDGLHAMEERYGFAFRPEKIQLMDLDGVYEALRDGECDIAEGYATDGRGVAWEFTNLEDPLAFFPFYNPAPVIREEVLNANPELKDLLNSFGRYLDDSTMSQLNARVDIGADGLFNSGDEESPAQVAQDFLSQQGLIQSTADDSSPEQSEESGDASSSDESETSDDSQKPQAELTAGQES